MLDIPFLLHHLFEYFRAAYLLKSVLILIGNHWRLATDFACWLEKLSQTGMWITNKHRLCLSGFVFFGKGQERPTLINEYWKREWMNDQWSLRIHFWLKFFDMSNDRQHPIYAKMYDKCNLFLEIHFIIFWS